MHKFILTFSYGNIVTLQNFLVNFCPWDVDSKVCQSLDINLVCNSTNQAIGRYHRYYIYKIQHVVFAFIYGLCSMMELL
jgi:hypothetical protein